MCLSWSKCPSLLNYYTQYQNYPGIREYFAQSRRNCGANRFSRDPLVCCNISNYTTASSQSQQYQQPLPQATITPPQDQQSIVTQPFFTELGSFSYKTPIQGRLLTPQEGCGTTNVPNHRIVGGRSTRPGDFE